MKEVRFSNVLSKSGLLIIFWILCGLKSVCNCDMRIHGCDAFHKENEARNCLQRELSKLAPETAGKSS